jgi:oligosaccharide repeat unit polymerase
MRSRMLPSLSYVSFLMVPGAIILMSDSLLNGRKKAALAWFLSGTFLISLLGYRTEIYAMLIGGAISAYYIKGPQVKRSTAVKLVAAFAAAAVALNLGVVAFREMPAGTYLERLSFTTYVFSSLVDFMGFSAFGHSGGMIHASILSSLKIIPGTRYGPRTFISQLVGVGGGSTTPTVLGIPYADFGLAGVAVTGLLLGLLFGSGYRMLRRGDVDILPVHALCMAFLIITIETGIADAIVLLYLIAYLVMVI